MKPSACLVAVLALAAAADARQLKTHFGGLASSIFTGATATGTSTLAGAGVGSAGGYASYGSASSSTGCGPAGCESGADAYVVAGVPYDNGGVINLVGGSSAEVVDGSAGVIAVADTDAEFDTVSGFNTGFPSAAQSESAAYVVTDGAGGADSYAESVNSKTYTYGGEYYDIMDRGMATFTSAGAGFVGDGYAAAESSASSSGLPLFNAYFAPPTVTGNAAATSDTYGAASTSAGNSVLVSSPDSNDFDLISSLSESFANAFFAGAGSASAVTSGNDP